MFSHKEIRVELEALLREAEEMEKNNAALAEHGRGSELPYAMRQQAKSSR